jgi:hypothetical protein
VGPQLLHVAPVVFHYSCKAPLLLLLTILLLVVLLLLLL